MLSYLYFHQMTVAFVWICREFQWYYDLLKRTKDVSAQVIVAPFLSQLDPNS